LVAAGLGSTDDLLELIKGYANESEFQVWEQLASRIASIRSVWFEQPQHVRDGLEKLDRDLFGRVAHELGWDVPEGEDYMKSRLRQLAIERAGLAGDEAVVSEAKERFSKIVQGDDWAVHPDLRASVLTIGVKFGTPAEWEAARDLYIATTTEDQKLLALEALGMPRDEATIQRALEFSMSEHVRPQDIFSIFSPLNSNTTSRPMLWTFIKDKWGVFAEKYEGSLGILGFIVKVGTRGGSSDDMIADVEAFFADKDTKRVERPLQQSMEQMKISNKWLKRDAELVEKWLSQ
jgi:aminopeptidase 2